MRALRLISLLVALTGWAPVTRADFLDWLFHHDVEVIVDTDIMPEGAKLPAVSMEHPVYYVGVSMGYRDLGGIIAGDKLPSKGTMYDWIAKALAKQGYLPADDTHPPTHERLPDMFKRDIPEFLERSDISDETKKMILYDNPKQFYNLNI